MQLIHRLYQSFVRSGSARAFCINKQDISYREFLASIEGTRKLLQDHIPEKNKPVGIVTFETIETYAAFFACWFTGHYFIPLHPKHPAERNRQIIEKTGIRHILSCRNEIGQILPAGEFQLLINGGIRSWNAEAPPEPEADPLLYIMPTSGSTGAPKYVPIRKKNVEAYCTAFLKEFPELNRHTCVLQVHDHTTDASFTSYLLPLLAGGCVCTLPEGAFKFLSIARMMAGKTVTWVKLTPSVLAYLDRYIEDLDLNHLQFFGFGGEALPVEMLKKWRKKFPAATVVNFYGPTEGTMNATFYRINKTEPLREKNGIVAIGRAFDGISCAIIDEHHTLCPPEKEGELCLAGRQVMDGYLTDEPSSPFIELPFNGTKTKFYRTGDRAVMDHDGYCYFTGRTDDQVKIEGFRVNLIEVENTLRKLLPGFLIAAVACEKFPGLKRIYLFIENFRDDENLLKQKLARQLPSYMIPEALFSVEKIPFTSSGKIDRQKLRNDYLYHP
jgi:D-alanine--poly(phosphoribitol) ligase subunit 1